MPRAWPAGSTATISWLSSSSMRRPGVGSVTTPASTTPWSSQSRISSSLPSSSLTFTSGHRMLPHRRARAGIGTKRQVVSVFADLTVRENLWVAAYAPRAGRSVKQATAAADDLVTWLGLDGAAVAGTLSHGDQQRLEIVMVMAAGASLILLDEPTAGMTVDESAGMAALIHTLSEHCSVVVIDHDMGFVRELGAPITVMHLGRVLMRGVLDDLEAD